MSIFELMAAPFAECMVLVGIHTYLGIHVLRRRVIFVDLALAQIAALGTMVGFLFGIMPETSAALIVSMAFTFAGAAVFALSRSKVHAAQSKDKETTKNRIPQEAVIGLVYAITAATAVLVVEKTQGAEHLKDILVGSILWVKWGDVAMAAIAYTIIGAVHFIFRRQFMLISDDPEEATRQGLSIRVWDFFFYVTFGFVITFSTRVAGVLLVFVFLVAPAIMAFLITTRLRDQLLIGWGMGTVVTVIGLVLSYVCDLPSGPSVVAFYGIALLIGALIRYVVRSPKRVKALGWIGTGAAATTAATLVFCGGATLLGKTSLAVDRNLARVASEMKGREIRGAATARPEAVHTVGALAIKPCDRYLALPDAQARLELIEKQLGHCERGGLKLLLVFLADTKTPPFFRSEGVDLLKKTTGEDFGYDADIDVTKNADALEKLQRHILALPRGVPAKKSPAGEHCGC
jgi:zinc/manganese transport system permease protein